MSHKCLISHCCLGKTDGRDSVECAVIQKGMPAALRTYLLVNSPNASDWTVMKRSMQSYLLATASAPKAVPMDFGCVPWSSKGKGDGKDK
eukprot:504326-Amphidinium_carterae.1